MARVTDHTGLIPPSGMGSDDPLKVEDQDDEEEDVDACRICRTSSGQSPLYYPCACSGSIKYVHQECLLQWLDHSNARQCEVCKHPFTFSPVYAENAPARLSYHEFVLGLAIKAGRSMHFFLRLSFVLSVWLVFIPFMTFWIWRLAFIRNISEAKWVFIHRLTPTLLFTDCVHGFLLSAGIVFIFLGATSLREYFRHLRELGGHVVDRENDVQGREVRRQAEGDRVVGGDGVANREGGGIGQGIAVGAGQLIRRNAENVAARLEQQAARLEAHVEQMFDGADDVDDVPFDELVGMQGPVFHLLENALTVLASNTIFLGLVAFLPFTLGRIVLSLASLLTRIGPYNKIIEPSGSNSSSLSMFDTNQNINTKMGLANVSEIENSILASSSLFKMLFDSNTKASPAMQMGETGIDATSLKKFSDATTVAAGYMVVIAAVGFHLALRALIKYMRGEPLAVGRLQRVTSLAEAAPTVARQVIAALKYIMMMFKVAFLLLVELGVFPLLCGGWLDICTLSMFGGTIGNRVAFFWASPLTSSLLHWLVGIVYMLHISIFVSLLREVLKPGVLYFLRDPADPNYNPFHDLVEDPIHKHARRVLLSVLVYGSLIVMLIFLPLKLALFVAPSLFPLDIRISDPFTEIPADMLLFHICIPFAIEHFRPKATLKTVLFHWFSVMGWALGLLDFLLPPREEANDQGRGLHDQEVPVHGIEQLQAPVNDVGVEIDHQNDSEEYMFVFRIVLLLLGAWITLLVFNSSMMLLPVSLGRAIFSSISSVPIIYGVKCNDLYAFNIGCYVIWATVAAIGYAVNYLKTHNAKILLLQIMKWTGIIWKSSLILTFWIIVIPVLIGLLFELLVVIPLRVPIDESPMFLLYQDWALGLVFLKIWTRLVMLGQVAPLVDDSWRTKFERVKADGFTRLQGLWIMHEIVLPILVKLLTALCVPYVFARGFFPVLGYPLIVNSAVYRFAWSGCLLLGLTWYGVKRLQYWLSKLHNSIRDDRYLIGKRLHNYGGGKDEEKTAPLSSYTFNQPDANGCNVETSSCSIANTVNSNNEILIDEVDVEQENEVVSSTNCIEECEKDQLLLGLRRRHNNLVASSSSMA